MIAFVFGISARVWTVEDPTRSLLRRLQAIPPDDGKLIKVRSPEIRRRVDSAGRDYFMSPHQGQGVYDRMYADDTKPNALVVTQSMVPGYAWTYAVIITAVYLNAIARVATIIATRHGWIQLWAVAIAAAVRGILEFARMQDESRFRTALGALADRRRPKRSRA